MGPIWDLNIGYNRQEGFLYHWIANYNNYVQQDAGWYPFGGTFIARPIFQQRLKQRWEALRQNEFSNIGFWAWYKTPPTI